MMWYWGSGMHWLGWLLGSLAMVVFWGLVIWGIWYFVTNLTRRPGSEHRPGQAKHILDERLARGEIDAEEYQRLRDVMRDDVHAGDGQGTVGTGGRR